MARDMRAHECCPQNAGEWQRLPRAHDPIVLVPETDLGSRSSQSPVLVVASRTASLSACGRLTTCQLPNNVIPMTITFLAKGVLRVGANVVVGYALGGALLGIWVLIQLIVIGTWPYDLDPFRAWTWMMSWAVVAGFLVVPATAVLDVLLAVVPHQRVVAIACCLAGAVYWSRSLDSLGTAWLVSLALLFGASMALPPARSSRSLTSPSEDPIVS